MLTEKFIEIFGESPEPLRLYFAPGRVNIIGEHVDYNGGWVLPMALAYGTTLAIRKRPDKQIQLASLNDPYRATIASYDDLRQIQGKWVNYPLGIFREYLERSLEPGGFEMLFSGDIPKGAGLSSSASIEMVTSYAINDYCGFNLDIIEQIRLAQHAENHFVGMNCGIMDQFSVGVSKGGNALLLNCDTLEHNVIRVKINDYVFVIVNSHKDRELTGSKYNERRSECEKAVSLISRKFPVATLGELAVEELPGIKALIRDAVVYRRAKHVITEIDRVHKAVIAMEKNQVNELGRLMNRSHESLRDDYEVSCTELDLLADLSIASGFAAGARMTGAGFGGCIVSLVQQDKLDLYKRFVSSQYLKKTGIIPDFYLTGNTEGIRRII